MDDFHRYRVDIHRVETRILVCVDGNIDLTLLDTRYLLQRDPVALSGLSMCIPF